MTYKRTFVSTFGRCSLGVGLFVLCALGGVCAAAPAADPVRQRLYLSYGDYMTGFNDMHGMVQSLVTKNQPDQPGFTRLGLGVGAHGDTIAIWQSGAVAWINGTGTVEKTN